MPSNDNRLERARKFWQDGVHGRPTAMWMADFAASETAALETKLLEVEKENAELRAEVERLKAEDAAEQELWDSPEAMPRRIKP